MKSLIVGEIEQAMGQWSDTEIEKLYKSYQYNKELLVLLEEPSLVSQLRLTPSAHNCSSMAEHVAVNKAQADIEIKMVESCLRIMNDLEREFIELRYFQELDIKMVCNQLRFSRSKIFETREKILSKSKKLFSQGWMFSETSILQKLLKFLKTK